MLRRSLFLVAEYQLLKPGVLHGEMQVCPSVASPSGGRVGFSPPVVAGHEKVLACGNCPSKSRFKNREKSSPADKVICI